MQLIPLMDTQPALTLNFLEGFIKKEEKQFMGVCDVVSIGSCFQPVYSFAHQRIVGYEALARPISKGGQAISPLTLFSSSKTQANTVFMDRLCRAVHVKNFVQQGNQDAWLFLNINPAVMKDGKQFGSFFSEMLEQNHLSPKRIVVEVLENQIANEQLLDESIQYYRELGCLIAIDDFGVGQSNFDRIWRLKPHIIKLDRAVIEQAQSDSAMKRVLPGFVSLIHQAGSLALIEGVETEAQAMIALEADIDFVQGYFFAKPERELLILVKKNNPEITSLFEKMRKQSESEQLSWKLQKRSYTNAFLEACKKIKTEQEVESSLQDFLDLSHVKRAYILDNQGKQEGRNYLPPSTSVHEDMRFSPLHDGSNAIWARRIYYRKAVEEPGHIHISKPYLSITEGELCVTLSMAITTPVGLRVVCGDIEPFWL